MSRWVQTFDWYCTLNSPTTAPVDIPAVSMPIARSLRDLWHCCVNKLHIFDVAFYYPQHKVHLCNKKAVQSASWYASPVRWMDYLGKEYMLTNSDAHETSFFCVLTCKTGWISNVNIAVITRKLYICFKITLRLLKLASGYWEIWFRIYPRSKVVLSCAFIRVSI
jgi:hypothetical protein